LFWIPDNDNKDATCSSEIVVSLTIRLIFSSVVCVARKLDRFVRYYIQTFKVSFVTVSPIVLLLFIIEYAGALSEKTRLLFEKI
jgi:hypothetical protein